MSKADPRAVRVNFGRLIIAYACLVEDGQQLACGLVNTTAQVFNMPLKGRGCAFAGEFLHCVVLTAYQMRTAVISP